MKRIRVAPGKFVTISTELAEKAARVFVTGLTRDQVHNLQAGEPRRATGLITGSAKPLPIVQAKTRASTRPTSATGAPARKVTALVARPSGELRRKTG